jgi:predicted metalloprotease
MRFQNEGRGEDIQDRRGMSPGVKVGAGLGVGGTLIVALLSLLMGKNPADVLGSGPSSRGGGPGVPAGPRNAGEAQAEQLVRRATTDIQDFWTQALPQMAGRPYQRTQLVLFADEVRSGCGSAGMETGPFYCPRDSYVYIDLGFYAELDQRFRAPGDFAQAYVLAHEFGHHIQHQLGIDRRVRSLESARPDMANPASVALELQADCFAGVWGASAARRGMLDAGDMQEGLGAAAAVGDDRIQRSAGRRVNPESFTHGSAAQRASWFQRGMQAGNITACDTFGNGTLMP